MLRAVLRPAPLGLLALALAIATACALLGQWQVERSRAATTRPALERVVPLTQVLEPATTFTAAVDGQVVSVTGTFAGADQLLVPGRLQDGVEGTWVLAPLAVTDGGGTALLPVVRGWLPPGQDPALVPAPPAGEVDVQGRLIAGEPPQGLAAGGAVSAVSAVSPADLVNLWDAPLYTGFLITAAPLPPAPLELATSRAPSTGTDWRNISYALQWWLFAGFAVVVWWRVVRDRYLLPELDEQDRSRHWDDGAARPEHHDLEVR